MSLILKLEAMAGDTIEDTCYEMVSIASKLNICVQVKFNDVTLMSYWGGDAHQLVQSFKDEVGTDRRFKFVSTHGNRQ
jgi:hypothetical protein